MTTQLDVLYELFDGVSRQGPGDNASTRKAWALLGDVPPHPTILDIGCGSGLQTLELARITSGRIIALDNHQPYLDILQQRAAAENLVGHIETVNCSMLEMDFDPGTFDVIWSEGALYILGFDQGLATSKSLLKPSGYLVVSEMSWFTPDPPQELQQFLSDEQIDIRTLDENLQRIDQAGYHSLGHFPLPQESWLDNFYNLVEKNIAPLQQKYREDPELLVVVSNMQREIQLYRAYSNHYGYIFYAMQVKSE